MMIEWLMVFIGAIMCVVGVLGSFLPVIPGPPMSFVALLLIHFSSQENRFTLITLLVLFAATILITALDYVMPIWGSKKFGGTKYSVWGSTIGLIIGMFLGPFGIIFGPFIGSLIAELVAGRKSEDSLRSAWGSLVGFLFGTGIKLLFTLFVSVLYFSKLIYRVGDII